MQPAQQPTPIPSPGQSPQAEARSPCAHQGSTALRRLASSRPHAQLAKLLSHRLGHGLHQQRRRGQLLGAGAAAAGRQMALRLLHGRSVGGARARAQPQGAHLLHHGLCHGLGRLCGRPKVRLAGKGTQPQRAQLARHGLRDGLERDWLWLVVRLPRWRCGWLLGWLLVVGSSRLGARSGRQVRRAVWRCLRGCARMRQLGVQAQVSQRRMQPLQRRGDDGGVVVHG